MDIPDAKQALADETTVRLEAGPLGDRLIISGALTVTSARRVLDEIRALLPRQHTLEIDLAGVSDFDSAGLQLLLLIKRSWDQDMRFVNHSQAVVRALDIYSLSGRSGWSGLVDKDGTLPGIAMPFGLI